MKTKHEPCGNPDCDQTMPEHRGLHIFGHKHIMVCSHACQGIMWERYHKRYMCTSCSDEIDSGGGMIIDQGFMYHTSCYLQQVEDSQK